MSHSRKQIHKIVILKTIFYVYVKQNTTTQRLYNQTSNVFYKNCSKLYNNTSREISLQEYYQKQQQYKLQLHHIKLLKNKLFEISKDDLNDSQTKLLKQDISKIRKIRSQQQSDKIKIGQENKYQKDYKHISILKDQIKQNNKQIPLILEKQISSVYKNQQIKLLKTKTQKYNEMINNVNDRAQ
ncbi:hypothetical protein SS50377_21555 [Spironucleus salmonicida]|uniref:Uncharacterized protein n=1 Tax=Spironucleus salmonicida TaxID=348837 RepID=V6LFS6_9EUKA|nr:hypothetical protein SS50377_21555 [Spironucleus salmonicida]|eukprot:EST43400.1 Hypothetical protein SS50377_16895 [Spironucleus salmonicida]